MILYDLLHRVFGENRLIVEILYFCLQIYSLAYVLAVYRDVQVEEEDPSSALSMLISIFFRFCVADFYLGFFVSYSSHQGALAQGFLIVEFILLTACLFLLAIRFVSSLFFSR